MAGVSATRPPRRSPRALAPAAALLGLTVPVLLVLVLGLAAWMPDSELLGATTPLVVPVYGPAAAGAALLLLTAAAAVGSALRRRRSPARAAAAVVVLAAIAATAILVPVGANVGAVLTAGGSVNLLDAAVLDGDPTVAPDQRTVYTSAADGTPLHLSVWRPAPGPTPAPMFVWVHGGGWFAGSDLDRTAELHRWAQRGWLVASVEYGLATPGHPTWDQAAPQVACALATVAAQAVGLGADPTRLVLAGGSAGGQLAVSVAYHAATGTQSSSCAGTVPVPRAVAVEYPALDPVEGYDHGARSSVPALDAQYSKTTYLGGTPTQVPERYRAVSGVDALSTRAPPTLVLAAGRDRLVPLEGLTRFVDSARARGVDTAMVELPFVDHAFDTVDGSLGQQAAHSIMQRWADEIVDR